MSITNLTTLKSTAIAWAAREGETSIEKYIDAMVDFAEARLERELRIDSQLRSVTYTPATDPSTGDPVSMGSVALPDDYNALSVVRRKNGQSFIWRPHDELDRCGNEPTGNCQLFYTIMGCELILLPVQTSQVTVRYYKKFPRLASLETGAQTHAQLMQYPDLYLYGTLSQLIVFDRAYEEAPTWEAQYARILGEIELQNLQARYPQDQALHSSLGFRGQKYVP